MSIFHTHSRSAIFPRADCNLATNAGDQDNLSFKRLYRSLSSCNARRVLLVARYQKRNQKYNNLLTYCPSVTRIVQLQSSAISALATPCANELRDSRGHPPQVRSPQRLPKIHKGK
jgi:hypothetical protein